MIPTRWDVNADQIGRKNPGDYCDRTRRRDSEKWMPSPKSIAGGGPILTLRDR